MNRLNPSRLRLNFLKAAPRLALALLLVCLPVQGEEKVVYIHPDLLGSPVAATDADGELVWRELYKPYGERVFYDVAAAGNRVWYTSRPFSTQTGLAFMGARDYDPSIGRFYGIDPVGFQADNLHSFNRYAYANNNPYKYVDRSGNVAETVFDLVSLGLSVDIFVNEPSVINALGMLVDGAAVAAPFAASGVGVARKALEKRQKFQDFQKLLKATQDKFIKVSGAVEDKKPNNWNVGGGRARAKELFRKFADNNSKTRTVDLEYEGDDYIGRAIQGKVKGTEIPIRIRFKKNGNTRIQLGKLKFRF